PCAPADPALPLHPARTSPRHLAGAGPPPRPFAGGGKPPGGAPTPPICRAAVDRVVSRHVKDVPTPDHAHRRYFIISSGGMMPHRLAADGSLGHTFGFCGWSRCHGRGSK